MAPEVSVGDLSLRGASVPPLAVAEHSRVQSLVESGWGVLGVPCVSTLSPQQYCRR